LTTPLHLFRSPDASSFTFKHARIFLYCVGSRNRDNDYTGCPKSLEQMGILFIIYYLHYMLYMFIPTLYAFFQPLYHVCADFAQHIGIDSSTIISNSLPKVTKISDFNSIHLCLQEYPECKVSTLLSNVNAIFSLLTFNFNL
jgi:hypothetical protein